MDASNENDSVDSFDRIGDCAACNGNGLCRDIVHHIGVNAYRLRNTFDSSLSGRDLINNIWGELQNNPEHSRHRGQDLTACVPVWLNGIERNNFGDNNDGNNNNGNDDDEEDDDGDQGGGGPYALDGGFSGDVLAGVNDSFQEHRLGADREDQNILRALLREARVQVEGGAAEGNPISTFSAAVNDRLRAIEGARAICKREKRFKSSTSTTIKDRINLYLQQELPHSQFSTETANLLYGLFFHPESADAAMAALDDEDFQTAYRIFKTQGEDEGEFGEDQPPPEDEDEGSDVSEYDSGYDTEEMFNQLDNLGAFNESDEEEVEVEDPPQDTSGSRRSRPNDDDDDEGGNMRQRRRSSRN